MDNLAIKLNHILVSKYDNEKFLKKNFDPLFSDHPINEILIRLFKFLKQTPDHKTNILYLFKYWVEKDKENHLQILRESIKGKGMCPKVCRTDIRNLIKEYEQRSPSAAKPSTSRKDSLLYNIAESHISESNIEAKEENTKDKVDLPIDDKIVTSVYSDTKARSKSYRSKLITQTKEEKFEVLGISKLIVEDLRDDIATDIISDHLKSHYPNLGDKSLDKIKMSDLVRIVLKLTKTTKEIYPLRLKAKIFLNFAKLLLEQSNVGENLETLRHGISGYCTRIGEYLYREKKLYDVANEYFLEGIRLQLIDNEGVYFPTRWFFESTCLKCLGKRDYQRLFNRYILSTYKNRGSNPEDYLELFSKVTDENLLRNLTLAFFELSYVNKNWALSLYERLSERSKTGLRENSKKLLGINYQDIQEIIRHYSEILNTLRIRLSNLLNTGDTIDEIINIYFGIELSDDFLSSTDKVFLQKLQEFSEYVETYKHVQTYEEKKTIFNKFEYYYHNAVTDPEINTRLLAELFNPLFDKWFKIIQSDFQRISQDIAPVLEVSLSKRCYDFSKHKIVPLIVKIKNVGGSSARHINLTLQKEIAVYTNEIIEKEIKENEEKEFKIEIITNEDFPKGELIVSYTATFCDLDGHTEKMKGRFRIVNEIKDEEYYKNYPNPFQTQDELSTRDQNHIVMFKGRHKLMEEVYNYSLRPDKGSLIMLWGQRRVGKSSFLNFLEDKFNSRADVIAIKLTWLDYSKHTVAMIFEEISEALIDAFNNRFDQNLQNFSLEEYEKSYTYYFNSILKQFIKNNSLQKIIILMDEFDVIATQVDDNETGFDRSFFEYLRGLTKRKDFVFVATGSDYLPELFNKYGDVFNHDYDVKISNLPFESPNVDPHDSVETLIQNPIISQWLTFNQDAIQFIKELTACSPFYLQKVCEYIVDDMKANFYREVSRYEVINLYKRMLRESLDTTDFIHLYAPFAEKENNLKAKDKINDIQISILSILALARRNFKESEIINQFHDMPASIITNEIKELIRREVLRVTDNGNIDFYIPFFKEWFKMNLPFYNLTEKYLGKGES